MSMEATEASIERLQEDKDRLEREVARWKTLYGAASILIKLDDITFPLPGNSTVQIKVPRPMTREQWDYLMKVIETAKDALVAE